MLDDGNFETSAILFARSIADGGPRRTGDRVLHPAPELFERFARQNADRIELFGARAVCIETIPGATEMALVRGRENECALFFDLVKCSRSKSFRHLFFAERAAAKIPDASAYDRRPVAAIGIADAAAGIDIALCCLSAGLPTMLVDPTGPGIDQISAGIRRAYEVLVAPCNGLLASRG